MKKLITLATCLLVAGCAEYQTAKPVDVVFNAKRQSDLTGYSPLQVRAFTDTVSSGTEITGVPCDVIGSGFSARIATPAAVNVPVYGLRSKALYVKCTYKGEVVDKTISPVNITEHRALANGANGGLIGVLVVGAVVAARKNKESDEYGYRAPQMVFKEPADAE